MLERMLWIMMCLDTTVEMTMSSGDSDLEDDEEIDLNNNANVVKSLMNAGVSSAGEKSGGDVRDGTCREDD